jgi:hypothetical protein
VPHIIVTVAEMELLKAQKVIIICLEGDIQLRGAHNGSKDLLLASSQVLSKVSESFSKLLQTRNLPTGQSFSFTNEVKFPEDLFEIVPWTCTTYHQSVLRVTRHFGKRNWKVADYGRSSTQSTIATRAACWILQRL